MDSPNSIRQYKPLLVQKCASKFLFKFWKPKNSSRFGNKNNPKTQINCQTFIKPIDIDHY